MKTIRSNKKGFGIHSPFVYHLVTEVLFSFPDFYAFKEIDHLNIKTYEKQRLRILFRLLSHFQPEKIMLVGEMSENDILILKKAVSDNEVEIVNVLTNDAEFQQFLKYYPFVIFEKYPDLELKNSDMNSVWFIKKNNSNKIPGQTFQLMRNGYGIVTIKLHHSEIIIFDKRFPDQDYVIK